MVNHVGRESFVIAHVWQGYESLSVNPQVGETNGSFGSIDDGSLSDVYPESFGLLYELP